MTGAVIVTWNSEQEIGRCLDSAAASGIEEIIVVDNASTDGTVEQVRRRPGVRLIANPWNRGFAAAVNQGIGAARSPFVLLLNPDTELLQPPDVLVQALQDGKAAIAGGKLLGSDGKPQTGFSVRRFPTPAALAFEVLGINRLWPGNPVNRRYRCLDLNPETAAEVDQPAGAFFAIKRTVWRDLGGLDETFRPVWFEDVDICKRAKDNGYRVCYVPSAVARHAGGHSVGKVPWNLRQGYWYGNLLKYAGKHFGASALSFLCFAVIAGSVFRMVVGLFLWRSARPPSAFVRVIRLAGLYLVSSRTKRVGLPVAV